MPHFTLQIGPDGPMLTPYIGVSEGRLKVLTDSQAQVPGPTQIRALVDTGASCTCVDPSVLTGLNLTPTGNVPIITAGGTPENRDQYDVALIIPGPDLSEPLLIFSTIAVVATNLLQAQGFHALIGRDILGRCIFAYNGTMRTFTLAY